MAGAGGSQGKANLEVAGGGVDQPRNIPREEVTQIATLKPSHHNFDNNKSMIKGR